MTLQEAIEHCLDVAEREPCRACAEEHRQLAEWLAELQDRRRNDGTADAEGYSGDL